MSILVIAEVQDNHIHPATYVAVNAAQVIGEDIHVIVATQEGLDLASTCARISGVTQVLSVQSDIFKNPVPENLANQVLQVAAQYSHIIMASTSFGKATLPRIAARLDVEQISEVTKIIDKNTFECPIYAGNVILTVKSEQNQHVFTVRTTAFEMAKQTGNATIKALPAVSDFGKSVFIKAKQEKKERPDLSSAKYVVAGGQGVGSKENFQLIEQLADKLGAAIGASRAAVDAGFVGNDLQVGQTGKIIAPQLYIAIGISGAVQHMAGIKDAKVVVAINNNPDAPIFLSSDYGIVGDLNELVPQLIQAV